MTNKISSHCCWKSQEIIIIIITFIICSWQICNTVLFLNGFKTHQSWSAVWFVHNGRSCKTPEWLLDGWTALWESFIHTFGLSESSCSTFSSPAISQAQHCRILTAQMGKMTKNKIKCAELFTQLPLSPVVCKNGKQTPGRKHWPNVCQHNCVQFIVSAEQFFFFLSVANKWNVRSCCQFQRHADKTFKINIIAVGFITEYGSYSSSALIYYWALTHLNNFCETDFIKMYLSGFLDKLQRSWAHFPEWNSVILVSGHVFLNVPSKSL